MAQGAVQNDGAGSGSAVDKALAVIANAVSTPKGRAALSTLESELKAGSQDTKDKTSGGGSPSFPSKSDFAARMAAARSTSSARGGATA